MSPRGRSNLIRAALELREIADPLKNQELTFALENCLGCRACVSECPANVNLPLLKAELVFARSDRDGLTWRQKLISDVDRLGRLGCASPRLMNFISRSRSLRHVLGKILGVAGDRKLPHFARERFDRWFAKRPAGKPGHRGSVLLWDDTFVRYHEPHIGIAAVAVLEAAGYDVVLPQQRQCCGRPAFSQGDLMAAARLGQHNLNLLATTPALPVLFLEPSCYTMFKEDYREMNLDGAEAIAERCFLFEEFLENLLQQAPRALPFNAEAARIVIHTHCHAKATTDARRTQRIIARMPNRIVTTLDTGCCGMAGAFGMMESKYELSLKIAEPLIAQIKQQPYGTIVIASGMSCRQQIQHLSNYWTRHLACVLADALE
jgi:Fe-S oxidoreductase